ncbi:MAG: carboxypeptidase-like regulatory domain-containing protein, partial [Acidobacteria bacterium]|nr:carboxypeptidase-like regulatory domain-containing protein [Acidobacteriota bacterium]
MLILLMGLAVTPRRGFAQGSVTATLSGTVFDSSGAVVPGATITAKNKGTASTTTAVSGADGLFTIPALEPGNYTVTVTLQGFKTAALEDVRLNAGVPANIKPILEPGGLTETVTVEAAGEVLQTTQTSVATTLSQQQITNLPLPGRAAFDLVTFMPGVTTADGSSRGAMVNGLPTSAVNITLDGMNIQDNYAKT